MEELQDPLSSIYPCLFRPGALAGEEKRNKLTGDDEMTMVLLLLLLLLLMVMVMVMVMMVVVMGSFLVDNIKRHNGVKHEPGHALIMMRLINHWE